MGALISNAAKGKDSLNQNFDKAIKFLNQARQAGLTIEDYINQGSLFDFVEMTDVDWALVGMLRGDKANNTAFRSFINSYNQNVGQTLFGETTQQQFVGKFLQDNINQYETFRERIKGYERAAAQRVQGTDAPGGQARPADTPKDVRVGDRDTLFQVSGWHGTPHVFDEGGFKLNKVGTGEGAQIYGWGLYFTEDKSIAKWYRDTLTKIKIFVGDRLLDDVLSEIEGIEPYEIKRLYGLIMDTVGRGGGTMNKVFESLNNQVREFDELIASANALVRHRMNVDMAKAMGRPAPPMPPEANKAFYLNDQTTTKILSIAAQWAKYREQATEIVRIAEAMTGKGIRVDSGCGAI
jgi:hypothetical protein